MRRAEIVGIGALLISLALVTVGVKNRVMQLRRRLAQEVKSQLELESEVLDWWWQLKWWESPEGCAELVKRLEKEGTRTGPSLQ